MVVSEAAVTRKFSYETLSATGSNAQILSCTASWLTGFSTGFLKNVKNTFRKLELLLSSGGAVADTYSLWSFRKI
jgi:hypothetical protein